MRILRLAVWETLTCDRGTHNHSVYRINIASRSKKAYSFKQLHSPDQRLCCGLQRTGSTPHTLVIGSRSSYPPFLLRHSTPKFWNTPPWVSCKIPQFGCVIMLDNEAAEFDFYWKVLKFSPFTACTTGQWQCKSQKSCFLVFVIRIYNKAKKTAVHISITYKLL